MNKLLVIGVILILGVCSIVYIVGTVQLLPTEVHDNGNGNNKTNDNVPTWEQGKLWKLLQSDNVDLTVTISNETLAIEYLDRENQTVNITCSVDNTKSIIYQSTENDNRTFFVIPIQPIQDDIYNVEFTLYRNYMVYNDIYTFMYNSTVETWSW